MDTSSRRPSLFNQPLIQFLFIGTLLFAVDHYFSVQRDDPKQIFIDADRVAWLVDVFQQGQGRLPEPEEIENLIVKWSQNEVFYREAQALRLDQGDEMMRSRLILKMRNILFNRIVQENPDEKELREWFELNRAKYDVPPRYSFEQFSIGNTQDEQDAIKLAEELGDQAVPDSYASKLRQYPRRPAKNIQTLFGKPTLDAMLTASIGHWIPVRAKKGWLLARVTEHHPSIPADFDSVKTRVTKEFQEISADLQLVEMSSEIAEKYQLHREFNETELEKIIADASKFKPVEITAESRTLKARAGASKEQVN